MKINWIKEFPITSVCREDLKLAGFSDKIIKQLDDDDMTELAKKMAEAYTGNDVFWQDLKLLVEDFIYNKKRS